MKTGKTTSEKDLCGTAAIIALTVTCAALVWVKILMHISIF